MSIDISLLGGFGVTVDGRKLPPDLWARRQAAVLVKLLALSDGRRLHREQVIEAIWPGLGPDAAGPRLHKAAHYARRALGGAASALVLRNDLVHLLPDQDVEVDVDLFLRDGRLAIAEGSAAAAVRALDHHAGPLLPEDLYEPWSTEPREVVRSLHLELLRLAQRWEEVLEEEPADEEAHLALAGALADRGDRRGALRQLERMDQALRRELGTVAGAGARELRASLEASATRAPTRAQQLVRLRGRRAIGDALRTRLEEAATGRGGALVLSGPSGIGKTSLLDLAEALARRGGWRTGRGSASAVEGPWPYAPVLEALGDLCRQHPALLDGLDDVFRTEIDRALSGRELHWSGESGHQRLFVAAAELARLAAAGVGLLLSVDDVHDADEASLRLLHYLARCARDESILVVLTQRPVTEGPAAEILGSLVARDHAARISVPPLTEATTRRLLGDNHPDLDDATLEHVWQVSAGVPFTALELARQAAGGGTGDVVPALPGAVLATFRRMALLGTAFTTDELLGIAGVDEDEAYRHLGLALDALLVEPGETGWRFRHPMLREGLIQQLSPHAELTARRDVAEGLAKVGAAPSRIAHQFIAAGVASRAVPYVVRAVETAGALGAYREGLSLIEAVRHQATGEDLSRLLARRGDLLMALGDPAAVAAYREALPHTKGTERRLVRARLAHVGCFTGDLATARTALAGLELEGDRADAPILLASGNLAYFSGDVDAAWEIAGRARELLDLTHDSWQIVDLVSLQGLIAHQRGEWFERFRMELRRTHGKDQLAVVLFDAHLCVAEYLLYGPVPYDEVIAETEDLRQRASRAGALRGVAFATALIGEAALLMGDLPRAEAELQEALELHHDADAPAGEAHSLQRLAEVRLAQGDRVEAGQLLERALPLARWSMVSMHLLQRIYGTMIAAASTREAARTVVDRAEATLGPSDNCPFCDVMFAVPATIACADVGDLDTARRHLRVAETSAARWAGTAWRAGVLEARAHLARAEGMEEVVEKLSEEAARLFETAGHAAAAARCQEFASG